MIFRFHEALASLLIAALLVVHVPSEARAQEADTVVVRAALEEITIEESQDEESLFLGQLTVQRTSLAAQASPDVIRLLDHVPGLQVHQFGSSGAALASFRGLGTASTRVELDGIRLIDPATGTFDLSLIPAALIQGASVTTGASAGFTPGGVIGMTSPEELPASLSIASGSFGQRLLSAQGQRSISKTTWTGSFSRSVEDGDFSYADPVRLGSPRVRRDGADRSQAAAFLSAHRVFRERTEDPLAASNTDASPVRMRLLMIGTRVDRSLPVLSNAQGESAEQEDDLLIVALNLATSLGSMPADATLSSTHTDFYYESPDQPANRVQLREYAFRGGISRVLSSRWVLSVQPTFKYSRVQTETDWNVGEASVRASLDFIRDRALMGGYVDTRWRHTAAAHGALEQTQYDVAAAPGVWVGMRVNRGLETRLAAARVFRLPTLNERYWQPGGNIDLRPEHGLQVEWQTTFQPASGRLQARLVLFASRISNRIVWRPAFAGTQRRIWTPDNVARVSGRGVEAFVRWQVARQVTITASGTRLRQVDRSNEAAASFGHQLRFAAPWTASSEAEYRRRRSGLFASWRLTGRRYTATDESTWLPSHHVLDAGFVWHARPHRVPLHFRFTASNLLDAAYESSPWMPMPGRAWRMVLQVGR